VRSSSEECEHDDEKELGDRDSIEGITCIYFKNVYTVIYFEVLHVYRINF
jgi:hypothetical protein